MKTTEKMVSLQIIVPKGEYCYSYNNDVICKNFRLGVGTQIPSRCLLGIGGGPLFHDLDSGNVPKPTECQELVEWV